MAGLLEEGSPPELTVIDGAGEGRRNAQRVLQQVDRSTIPYGYEVWSDGLFMQSAPPEEGTILPSIDRTAPTAQRSNLRIIATKPVWVRRFGRDMLTGQELVELSYKDLRHDQIVSEWVTRAEISDKRTVTVLAARGLPMNSNNAQHMVRYLERAIARNGQTLEWVDVARRSGAIETPSGWGWLLGERWLGPPETQVVPDPLGDATYAAGYGPAGTEAEWFEKFSEVVSYNPVARWLTFSTFAAPLLRFCRRRTFLIHHWGTSGKGKTALAKFAMSAWGEAHELTQTFNRTEKSFTEMFEYLSDYPLCFDELQASGNEDHANIIYHLCLEKGRGRARQSGGLHQAIANWRSVVRMTGEEPIIGRGHVNLGGQGNRVIQINAPGLTDQEAGDIHRWLENGHCGWGGYRFLEHLRDQLQAPQGEEALQTVYTRLRTALEQRPDYDKLRDRTGHLAVVALAQYLAALWLFGGQKDYARRRALEDADQIAKLLLIDQDQLPSSAEMALQIFRDHLDANGALWLDLDEPDQAAHVRERRHGRLFGIVHATKNEIWLNQNEANKLLTRAELPTRVVWSELQSGGYLAPADGRNIAAIRTYGKFRNRVYVLKLHRFFGTDLANPVESVGN